MAKIRVCSEPSFSSRNYAKRIEMAHKRGCKAKAAPQRSGLFRFPEWLTIVDAAATRQAPRACFNPRINPGLWRVIR